MAYSWDDNDWILGDNTSEYFYSGGKKSVIYALGGNDKIDSWGSNSYIYGGAGNDTINVYRDAKNSLVDGGTGNDNIEVWADNVTIQTGSGNDTVTVYGKNAKISVGSGKNYLTLYDTQKTAVTGSAGNDEIEFVPSIYSNVNKFTSVTMTGGKGNDILHATNGADEFRYAKGDGNDVIHDYSGEDFIHLTSGSITDSYVSGNDVILEVGEGSIRVKNAKGKAIAVMDAKGNKTARVYGNRGKADQSFIQTFMHTLAGTSARGVAALDQAVRSSSPFKNFQDLRNHFLADCQKASSAEQFLESYCGINLNNKDTGAITGWEAGGVTTKTAESVVQGSGKMKNFTGTSFTKRGLTFIIPKGLNAAQQQVVNGLYTWWADGALKLIEESYGFSFTNAALRTIQVDFYSDSSAFAWASAGYQYDSMGRVSNLTLNINMAHTGTLNTGDANGSCSGNAGYMDRLLAHELTHSIMETNLRCFSSLPNFIVEGSADLTAGSDKTNEMKALAANPSALADYVNPAYNISEDRYVYAAGYMLLRYLGQQASRSYVPQGLSFDAKHTVLTAANAFSGTLDAGLYAGTFKTFDASRATKSVKIYGNAQNNTIYASKGGGTMRGQAGNDTLVGGAGKDVIWYGNGDGTDTVKNYTSGKDSIRIYKGSLASGSVSGKDAVLKVGTGAVKIAGGAGKTVSVMNANGNTVQHVFGVANKNTAWNYTAGYGYHGANKTDSLKITGAKAVSINLGNAAMFGNIDKIDASKATGKVTLTGGANSVTLLGGSAADVLTAGKAGAVLNGGKGNDTLTGGAGKDVIWYGTGDGTDTVKNYTSGKDSIRIYKGSLASGSVSDKDAVLKVGTGAVKVAGGAGKTVSVTNANGNTVQHVFGVTNKNTTWNYTVGYGYHGANKTDSLKVTGAKAVSINLGNAAMFGNIDKIDASKATGKMTLTSGSAYVALTGGSAADVLKAGKAGATLEGGKGKDMLYGGAGKDKFIFRKGYGQDTILSSGKGDIAYLYNIVKIGQAKFSLSQGVLSMKFTGSSDTLAVKNWSASGLNTVVLGDGTKYQLGLSKGKITTKKI